MQTQHKTFPSIRSGLIKTILPLEGLRLSVLFTDKQNEKMKAFVKKNVWY